MVNRLLPVVVFWLLASCAPRADLLVFPLQNNVGVQRNVFTATSRGPDEDGLYRAARSAELSYFRHTVSIPPEHVLGQIEMARGTPNPERHFLASSESRFDGNVAFRKALSAALAERPQNEREVILFVHGFNNTMADGVFRSAQLAQDFELPGVSVHYSWPSAANPLGYGYDRDSLLFARDGYESLLRDIRLAGARRVLVVAHSLGGLLTMETLRQMSYNADARRFVDGVFLISPDIDVEVFRAQANAIGDLPQPFLIFVSQKDRALQLSARLTGQAERLGTISDPEDVADLDVTIFDVTEFSEGGLNHFVTGNSPALIQMFRRLGDLSQDFLNDPGGRAGLIPGTVLTVQNATQIILTIPTALN